MRAGDPRIQALPRAGGNPVAPHPSPRARPSRGRGGGGGSPRGGGWGSQVSPRPCPAGGWGNRVSPSPHPVGGWGRAQPSRRGMGKPDFPTPPPRRGMGKPGFPIPPPRGKVWEGAALPGTAFFITLACGVAAWMAGRALALSNPPLWQGVAVRLDEWPRRRSPTTRSCCYRRRRAPVPTPTARPR